MPYLVNEIFYTLQGEGYWSGRAAVFCRFSRCNLWTGREEDRATAICRFCDTDFLHADRYDLDDLIESIESNWPGGAGKMVVFTGGEPTLQLDRQILQELRKKGWYVALETNGTMPLSAPELVDWVCVSPKANTTRVILSGNELKLVYPQAALEPHQVRDGMFDHFWLSPMDGPALERNTAMAIEYVKAHPQWRLNTQTHKQIGIR